MGPSGAFREITDRIQTNPPRRGKQEVGTLNQPSEPRKPGKMVRAGVSRRTGGKQKTTCHLVIVLATKSASS